MENQNDQTAARFFLDAKGRKWILAVNGWTHKRVKETCGVMLCGMFDDQAELLTRLTGDPILLCDVCLELCRDQLAEHDPPVSDRDFAEAFLGDGMGQARQALAEATVDFFDNPAERRRFRMLLEKIAAISERVTDQAEQTLQTVDPATEAKRIGDNFSALLESAALNRGALPSEN